MSTWALKADNYLGPVLLTVRLAAVNDTKPTGQTGFD